MFVARRTKATGEFLFCFGFHYIFQTRVRRRCGYTTKLQKLNRRRNPLLLALPCQTLFFAGCRSRAPSLPPSFLFRNGLDGDPHSNHQTGIGVMEKPTTIMGMMGMIPLLLLVSLTTAFVAPSPRRLVPPAHHQLVHQRKQPFSSGSSSSSSSSSSTRLYQDSMVGQWWKEQQEQQLGDDLLVSSGGTATAVLSKPSTSTSIPNFWAAARHSVVLAANMTTGMSNSKFDTRTNTAIGRPLLLPLLEPRRRQ
jgi:hypothetical protein